MEIQARDQRMLRCCYEQQFLTMNHLQRYFFRGAHRSASYRRVRELAKAGLLRLESHALFGGKSLIRITQAGADVVLYDSGTEVPQLRLLDYRALVHDSIVTSVRLRLEELWDGKWIPERVLKQKEYRPTPDGLFVFKSGKTVAIEVENSDKGVSRIVEHLNGWVGKSIFLLLYISTRAAIHEALVRHFSRSDAEVPLVLLSLSELEQENPRAWSREGELTLFTQKDY